MRRGPLLLGISAALVVVAVVVLVTNGVQKGVEFTGGTEIQLKYVERPDIEAVRSALQAAGLTATVTTIGAPEENEIYIRLAEGVATGDGASLTAVVRDTLQAGSEQEGKLDLNVIDQEGMRELLVEAPDLSDAEAASLAEAFSERRKEIAIFASVQDLADLPGITDDTLRFLEERAYAGPLTLRGQSDIDSAVSDKLTGNAILAVTLSLIVMLLYIWLRFQLQWGFAAVAALTHDTLITLGLFSLFQKELSLPVVAAFLTLVGYSVNDTVVVFDRIRENLRNRAAPTLEATIDLSINQTLGRTIITSGLTWVVVFGLYLYGGPALNAFAFVLSVGVIVGTYSSIYIASPMLIVMGRILHREVTLSGTREETVRRARKVRTDSAH
jgi:preprotein translocase subunit SecF